MTRALITGITGQDGSYLAELLLKKGYEVYGLVRRTSNDPLLRIQDLSLQRRINLVSGNVRDLNAVARAMDKVVPDEVYNLAAQSHVGVSFECPEETMDINYYGVGRVINEALRVNPKARIYQASTSEMFGSTPPPQNEETPMHPVSPYAEAKFKAYEDFVKPYRERGHFISSGILFNHESPRRGSHFVTRKITLSLAKIKLGLQESFELGNLDARRDWGFAGDYVEAMWKMLQVPAPADYVIATGQMHTVRNCVEEAGKHLGMSIVWSGKGVDEKGTDSATGKVIVTVNEKFYRPVETNDLRGDASKALRELGWKPTVTFSELIAMMAEQDLKLVEREYGSSSSA